MSAYGHLFKNRSLWFKFSIMTVVPVLIAALFPIFIILRSVETSMHHNTRAAMEALSRLTGLSMSNASVIYNKNLLDNFVDNLSRYQDILFAAVVDESDGRILAHSMHEYDGSLYDADRIMQSVTALHPRDGSPGNMEILVHPIVVEYKKYGDLIIGYSKAGVNREAAAFKGKVLSLAALTMIAGVLLAMGLSRFVSRPVRDIANLAQKIGAGESLPAITYRGRDALGQLVDSFNEMVLKLRDRREQLTIINRIAEELHQSLDRETVLRQAVDILAEYSGSPSVAFFSWDPEASVLRLAHHKGYDEQTVQAASVLPLEGSLTGLAVKQRDLIFSGDLTRDERLEHRVRRTLMENGFRGGVVCLPLIYKDRVMGVVNFIYKIPHSLPDTRRNTYLAVGRTIAMALANAEYVAQIEDEVAERTRAENALLQSVQELDTLNTLSKTAGRYLSVDQVAEAVVQSLHPRLKADVLMVYLLEDGELILKGMHKGNMDFSEENLAAHMPGDCLCGISARDGVSVFSIDIHSDSRCTRNECRDARLRSFAALPLLNGDRVVGLLGLGSLREYDYNKEAAFLETISRQVAISLVNAMLYEQIKNQADELEQRVRERTAELEVAMQQAQEADRIKSAFLASMSHELRTPLNSIIGFTGILLQGLAGNLNEEQQKQMGMVQTSARHLLRLINDVLDISKIEAGQLELSRELFNPAEALRRVIQIVSPLAEKKGLSISLDISPEVGLIYNDRRRVEQILINLLNNAVKFTDKGGIRVTCRREDSRIVTSVADTGIGIRAEDSASLFEAFRQIHTGVARLYEGTGLGLSISKRLTEMLGGEICVESRGEGQGSTFIFTLPSTSGEAT